jgi:large subunit ribosomal protein L15
LEELFEAGAEVTPQILVEKGIVKKRFDEIKILGDGELTKKLSVTAHRFSATAKEKIEKAGGTTGLVPPKTTVAEKRAKAKAEKAKK